MYTMYEYFIRSNDELPQKRCKATPLKLNLLWLACIAWKICFDPVTCYVGRHIVTTCHPNICCEYGAELQFGLLRW